MCLTAFVQPSTSFPHRHVQLPVRAHPFLLADTPGAWHRHRKASLLPRSEVSQSKLLPNAPDLSLHASLLRDPSPLTFQLWSWAHPIPLTFLLTHRSGPAE